MQLPIVYENRSHGFAYACFDCRKSFKRPWVRLKGSLLLNKAEADAFNRRNGQFQKNFGHPCPQCSQQTHFMGRDFKPPKTHDVKAWKKVERFIASGRTYHCGTRTDDII